MCMKPHNTAALIYIISDGSDFVDKQHEALLSSW